MLEFNLARLCIECKAPWHESHSGCTEQNCALQKLNPDNPCPLSKKPTLHEEATGASSSDSPSEIPTNQALPCDDEDELLQAAIRLSLEEK